MSLYTIVMDYCGGTYIRQVRATSPMTACRKWAKSLRPSDVYKLGETGKADLITKLDFDKPVLLEDLTNAWCICASVRGQLAVINVVKTDPKD